MEIAKEESQLQAVDMVSGKTLGSELKQRALFLPVAQPTDRIIAKGVGNLFEWPVIVERQQAGWRSVHVAVPAISDSALHEIYREAGVHLYTDAGVVLTANDSWVMLHTREARDYQVCLPRCASRVTEIATERTVGENMSSFRWSLDKFRTAIFLIE